jgi:hypothetical protein
VALSPPFIQRTSGKFLRSTRADAPISSSLNAATTRKERTSSRRFDRQMRPLYAGAEASAQQR